jgi:hypothetical protein
MVEQHRERDPPPRRVVSLPVSQEVIQMNSSDQMRFVQALRSARDNSPVSTYAHLVGIAEAIEWDGTDEIDQAEVTRDLARVFRELSRLVEAVCDNDDVHGREAWSDFIELLDFFEADRHSGE